MTTCVIDLNDYELRLARHGEVVTSSPGQVALVNGNLEIGAAAMAVAWTHPRTSENRYWRDLNTATVDHLGRRVRHHADLAWLQLEQLKAAAGNPSEVQFAVPGSFHPDQLSLLLGVTEACGLRTTALVDSAVAAGAAALGPGQWLHLDLQQHQAVLTRLEVGAEIVRRGVDVLAGFGINRLREACIRVITQAFVSDCRFDPRHHADTEQIMQIQLGQWLALLRQHAELKVQIEYRGRRFETRVQRAAVLAATAPLLRPLREAVPAGVTPVASHRLAAQPGFGASFPGVAVLGEKAVFQGMAGVGPSAGGLALLTSLPASAKPTVQAHAPSVRPDSGVTHLLEQHTATPLGLAPLFLLSHGGHARSAEPNSFCRLSLGPQGVEASPLEAGRPRLNGQPLNAATVLHAGDQITLGGTPVLYTAIRVLNPDAA